MQSNIISQKRPFRDETQSYGSVQRVIEGGIGDPWLVGCCVTGSYCGTNSDPNFSLLSRFRETIFPILADLVGIGGKYGGYTPIIQGDNSGLHEDAEFKKFIHEHCISKGWYW